MFFTFNVDQMIAKNAQGLQQKPDNQTLKVNLAGLYLSRNDLRKGMHFTRKALFSKLDNLAAQKQLLWSLLMQKKYEKAKLTAKRIIQRNDGVIPAINILALLYYKEGDIDLAYETWQTALENMSDDLALKLNFATIAVQNRDFPKALELYNSLPAEALNIPDILINKAIILAAQAEIDDAEELLLKALKLDPLDGITLLNLGIFQYFLLKDFPLAGKYFQRCVKATNAKQLPHAIAKKYLWVIKETNSVSRAVGSS